MANVTEKEIISYLKEKIKTIQAEAKKYEDLLNAFSGSAAPSKSAKQTKDNILDAVIEEAEDTSAKGSKKKADAKPAKGGKAAAHKALEVPAEYTPDLGLSGKIAFALNEIGEGFGQDIANAMAQYEPQSDPDKLFKQIASVLSNLKAKGALTTVKEGRRDKYTLAK
ncbi:hypothetical protein [Mucilaginibacter arboris]|uniref:Uncharacterized protein n=1 Tax=Mucilaginibacter arboris TaxID=2682090 RepID=A0A7K1SWV5_9SPHI|nr:hypothetical protein [Mucilaginibacter arboris]MVN21801.1 hypothetical protein [Mucilaginibacter arboris]